MPHSFWSSVRRGAAYGLPVLTALAPLAVLFGALAVGRGMSPFEATVMSATVFAGAAQFVAIDLWGHSAPLWSILVSVLAINFRHLLYSAAVTPVIRHLPWRIKIPAFFVLIDPAFAFIQENKPRLDLVAYFSLGISLYIAWVTATVFGVLFGQLLSDPEAYALDMLMPIYFLALVVSFRHRPNWGLTVVATFVVSSLVYKAPEWGVTFLGPPWHITLGGLGGMIAAAIAARPDPPEVSEAAATPAPMSPRIMDPAE
ncbi:branched-chain amino acid ABC transporter permease [Acuticoccus sediminis]|uniref:Branched-chain amino acid ABC transporter permease n=1 Tax=Acuticoccus sediminis TaxID=2184697 RepID=A0A8B2NYR0_9HYPH|nr:AzlC family ABC transporter permease [Acuticoccus sediminis]RAI03971.1 branched-chain amino acid ABC transporter permease [Acuticoccus sediminis]